jgi:amino acid transporter
LWIPCAAGILLIVLVYAHLSARIPITGFAYQWNSRLLNPHYGWFTGWTALLAFFAGTASIALAMATVFAPDIWAHPGHGQIVLLAGVTIAVAAIINVSSIRAVSAVNNTGVVFEIAGSIGAAALMLIGGLFFFHHAEGLKVLTQAGPAGGGKATWYGFALAALLPIYTLLGWEGSADLAEETNDPRAVTPRAMLRANYISVAASLFMIIGFAVAIPYGIKAMVSQPKNALVYIFQSHFGSVAGAILQVIVFLAIFSCLLANMAVATRMTFSLSRDRMLPGSGLLGRVDPKTRTPIFAILLVAVVAFGVNLLSEGIANNVVAIVNVSYYAIYVLTLSAVLYALRLGKIPEGLPGGFSLGRWLKPVAIAALLWSLVIIVDMGAPAGGHIAVVYLAGAEAIGVLWYLLRLRSQIAHHRAGVDRPEVLAVEAHSTALEPQ